MTPIRLALGIPVFNQGSTITQTVASVLAQTDPFDEIIVIDNHSTDETAKCLKSFEGKIRIISPPNHLSMAENWNFCVGQINSDWFSLLSGDDLLKPDFVASVRNAISVNPDAILIRTDWDVIDGGGSVLSVHKQLSVPLISLPPSNWKEQLHGPKVSFAAFSVLREKWKVVGGFPEDFHLFQDWMFWLKLAPLGKFVRVPISLAQYRSSHRQELEYKRVRLRVLDEHHYLIDILPTLPWKESNADRIIRGVRRRRLIDLLNYLSAFECLVDDELSMRLNTLAIKSDLVTPYQSWLVNRKLIGVSLVEKLICESKNIFRRLIMYFIK